MPAPTEPPASTAELIELMDSGARVRFLHFWKHDSVSGGPVGRGCLSQWAPIGFTVDDVWFATAEHYMMWSKAVLFGDTVTAARVLDGRAPEQAKTLGREVRGFDETVWKRARFDIVVAGSVAKFGQHDDLRAFLLGTGERILVEASPLDRIWGIGLSAPGRLRRRAGPLAWPEPARFRPHAGPHDPGDGMTPPSLRKDEQEPLPAWLAWPVRVVAVAVVVPVKLVWDLLVAFRRYVLEPIPRLFFLYVIRPIGMAIDYVVLRPLGWVLRYLIWVPLVWVLRNVLWLPLAWLAEYVIVPSLKALWDGTVWLARRTRLFWIYLGKGLLQVAKGLAFLVRLLYHYVLVPLAKAVRWTVIAVYRYLLRPLGIAVAWLVETGYRYGVRPLGLAVAWLAVAVWRYVLRPLGLALAFVIGVIGYYGVRPAGLLIAWFWRRVLVPVGHAIAWVYWAWNHSVVLLWRYLVVAPVRWTWQSVVAPTGRWIRGSR